MVKAMLAFSPLLDEGDCCFDRVLPDSLQGIPIFQRQPPAGGIEFHVLRLIRDLDHFGEPLAYRLD